MRELANTFNADTKVIIDTSTDINFDQTIRKRRKETAGVSMSTSVGCPCQESLIPASGRHLPNYNDQHRLENHAPIQLKNIWDRRGTKTKQLYLTLQIVNLIASSFNSSGTKIELTWLPALDCSPKKL